MRITNNIIRENALANMRRGFQQMEKAQQQVGTGLRLTRASDDPSAASSAMGARGSLRSVDQYRRAIDSAKLRASSEETVLERLDEILTRARVVGMSQGTGTANAQTRAIAGVEIDGLLKQAIGLANTELDGQHLFGGLASDVQPFTLDDSGATLDFTTSSPAGSLELEVSKQQRVVANHNGAEVFGTTGSGVLASLRELARAMKADDVPGILSSLNGVSDSLTHVQELTVDTGVRVNHLEVTAANLESMETNLLTLKSDLEEADLEEAISDLVTRQTAFQAAMLATSRVMGLTLTDYLR
jgi:flagellar hook-associated protein 3 FlgL